MYPGYLEEVLIWITRDAEEDAKRLRGLGPGPQIAEVHVPRIEQAAHEPETQHIFKDEPSDESDSEHEVEVEKKEADKETLAAPEVQNP